MVISTYEELWWDQGTESTDGSGVVPEVATGGEVGPTNRIGSMACPAAPSN